MGKVAPVLPGAYRGEFFVEEWILIYSDCSYS
jgi:hypothetical protein